MILFIYYDRECIRHVYPIQNEIQRLNNAVSRVSVFRFSQLPCAQKSSVITIMGEHYMLVN